MMEKSSLLQGGEPSDEELIEKIRKQDHDALSLLLNRYIPMITAKARESRIEGMDKDDIYQEAMIGFIGAVRNYQRERESSFKTFANLCVNRRIATAAQAQMSLKHKPFQNYVSIDEGDASVEAELTGVDPSAQDPAHIVIERESIREKKQQIEDLLSVFEREALMLYIGGFTYAEISRQLKSTPKAVDNALQRVRRKLRSAK